MTDIGTLPGGGESCAYGINDKGQVVGYSYTANSGEHAFLYSNDTMIDLGCLPGGVQSWACGINDNGQVAGYSDTASGVDRAFFLDTSKFATNTAVAVSTQQVIYGQPVTFTATVTSANGSGPTGSVQFYLDGKAFGNSVTLNGGVAQIQSAALAAGSHLVSATYTSNQSQILGSQSSSQSITVYPNQNAAFVIADPLNPTQTALYVFGTQGNDVILVNPGPLPGYVTVLMNGVNRGTFHPTGRIIVHGLTGNDCIAVSNHVTLPEWLYAGGGNDVLMGGGGPNLLFGGTGNSTLWGGNGRSILIGGTGKATLIGGAGDGLLIGGTTAYDANDRALLAIMNEWNSNADYATRVGYLTGTAGGLNGSYFLNPGTVCDNNACDALLGGNAMDAFFHSPAKVGNLRRLGNLFQMRRIFVAVHGG